MENLKNTIVSEAVLSNEEANQFRLRLTKIGSTIYGKRVVCVRSDNTDLKYKDNTKEGINQLKRPIKKYFSESIDVISLEPLRSPDGELCIVVNHRPELKFPVRGEMPKFINATEQDVLNAIGDFEARGTVQFFTDIELVNRVVISENERHAKFLQDLAEDFMNQATALDAINKIEKRNYDEYVKSFGE